MSAEVEFHRPRMLSYLNVKNHLKRIKWPLPLIFESAASLSLPTSIIINRSVA